MQGARFAAPAIIPAVILEVLGLVSVFSYLLRRVRPIFAGCICGALGVVLVATSISSPVFPAPVWHLSAVDDRDLIASGSYEDSHLWATLPTLLSCLRPGQSVATSEVGYFGFARQDLRFVDIRGLTDLFDRKEIAFLCEVHVGACKIRLCCRRAHPSGTSCYERGRPSLQPSTLLLSPRRWGVRIGWPRFPDHWTSRCTYRLRRLRDAPRCLASARNEPAGSPPVAHMLAPDISSTADPPRCLISRERLRGTAHSTEIPRKADQQPA